MGFDNGHKNTALPNAYWEDSKDIVRFGLLNINN
jgi:hypothetical protein